MSGFEELLKRANAARTRIQEISPDESRIRLNGGAVLIDVREEKEFRVCHIPGSILLSGDVLERRIAEAVPDTSTPVVVYCTVGHRSAIAADTLQKLGYRNVSSIAGGLNAYRESIKERAIA